MNRKSNIIYAAALLLVCGCAQLGGKKSAAPAVAAPEELVPTVTVVSATVSDVPQDAVYSSTVQANIVNNIAPQTAGRIVRINAEIGDFVNAGQILAEMDKVQLEQAQLRLKNSEEELERVRQLYEQGGVSQSDFDQMELSYKVAKSSYDNLLENTVLRSPVTGVVTARNYDKGDMYSMAQPLYTVQQITPVKLLVGISESDYTKVKKGDKAVVSADALPGRTFEGTIVRIYPTVDAATHTFNVEVQVRNADRLLRPGMYARVTVTFGVNRSIVIPDSAVVKLQGAGQRNVYVVDGEGKAQIKVVTLGRHLGDEFEILSGIEEGEKVVVKGQTALRNGIQVEILNQ